MPRSTSIKLFSTVTTIVLISLGRAQISTAQDDAAAARPNVLWITSEDNGPHLGCYGDRFADTPNLDALAARGMIYHTCWSNAPVCAPARTTIITGMYPTSLGAQHMRSLVRLPSDVKMAPQYLREDGYYCTNNSKEDYNVVKPGRVWDESSNKAHWKNRAGGQPFFAVFNHTISHESKIRTRPHERVHDPAKVRVPAYHPDAPEVRQDWAQYYDRVTEMDALAGANLRELAHAGLADDTIVFYYGDHGSGMPRSKRSACDSGLHVPLIVYIPEKFRRLRPDDYAAGGSTDRLVSFVDLAPTLLSLCGVQPPENMQGRAFAGEFEDSPRDYVFGFRGRMDERYDMVRSVSDGRYVYIRNYMPHRIPGQHVAYMFQTPTTRVWKARFDAGQLNVAQSHFWQTKPTEELYDLETDPDEVQNLAESTEHQDALQRMRFAQLRWAMETRDVGYLPEGEIHSRSADAAPYEMAQDDGKYPLNRIRAIADVAASLDPSAAAELMLAIADDDSAVRYWGAMGALIRGEDGVKTMHDELRSALDDESPFVRIAAAEALGRYGNADDAAPAMETLLELADLPENGYNTALAALTAIDYLDDKAASAVDRLAELPRMHPSVNGRMNDDIGKLLDKVLVDLR